MFFQPPEDQKNTNSSVKSVGAIKSARRKRRKREQKFKNKSQLLKKEKQRFANTMSSWAQNFTMAATWQMKHQVAHWKSRVKALEYENNILRTMLRQCYVQGKIPEPTEETDAEPGDVQTDNVVPMSASSESDTEESSEEENDKEECEENVEISEEFIQFLKGNADFRKMRLEREKTRKLEEEMPMKALESCPAPPKDLKAEYQRLYGVHWEKIVALEMSMQSQYMSICDREKPVLWPTIPLRL